MLSPIQTTLKVLPVPVLSASVEVNLPDAIDRQPPSLKRPGLPEAHCVSEAALFPASAVPWLLEVHELLTELVTRNPDVRRATVNEAEYKKLTTILEDLMWAVGDDEQDPLSSLFTCVGNFTLRYEDENFPNWDALWPELESADAAAEAISPKRKATASPPPGWADEEVALDAFLSMGHFLCEAGQVEKAIAAYDTAIRLNPHAAEAYCNRGSVHYALGTYAAAMRDYNEAIRLNPARGESYFNRAVTHFQLQHYKAAIRDYAAALARNPDDAGAYIGRAHAKFALHRYAAALLDYDAALRLTPDDDAVRRYRHLAQAQKTNGEP